MQAEDNYYATGMINYNKKCMVLASTTTMLRGSKEMLSPTFFLAWQKFKIQIFYNYFTECARAFHCDSPWPKTFFLHVALRTVTFVMFLSNTTFIYFFGIRNCSYESFRKNLLAQFD